MSARRRWLLPFSPLYGSVVTAKRRMYELGWLKQKRLPSPVISVGSVSAGGAGKLPSSPCWQEFCAEEDMPSAF